MNRRHLVELEDLPWVPRVVRDGGTDLLDVLFGLVRFYRPLAPQLVAVIDATGERVMLDLGSGAGGGALAMYRELKALGVAGLQLELTDRFPNDAARARIARQGEPSVRYRSTPLDAAAVPPGTAGLRTMFGALHHFQPQEIERILRDAVDANAPVAFFDVAASPALRRLPVALAPVAALPNLVLLFVLALVLTPLARPVRLSRFLLTYLVPAIPMLFAWDGTISAMRAYAPDELLAIAGRASARQDYRWSVSREGPSLCLIGRPAPSSSAARPATRP